MSKKKSGDSRAVEDHDPSEEELAACALVVELLRSGRILTFVTDILLECVDELDHPSEPAEAVVMRNCCELTVPSLAAGFSAGTLWQASGLLESVRDQIVTDFQEKLGDRKFSSTD